MKKKKKTLMTRVDHLVIKIGRFAEVDCPNKGHHYEINANLSAP